MLVRLSTIAIALFLSLGPPAAAQVSQATVTTGNLNMRAGPGTQHALIGQIPRGTWIHVFSCTNPVSWCQTVFGNVQGWISANYLNPRPTVVAQTPPATILPIPAPPPFPQPTVPGGIVVVGWLTNEGVECPTLRGDDGNLYSLVGNLGAFRPGDRVRVRGPIPQQSICMQGITIRVSSIDRVF